MDTQEFEKKQPGFDKTFIESPDTKTGFHALSGTSRMDATMVSGTNPYGQQGKPAGALGDTLPSGKEPIPLGSGKIVGLLGSGGMARVYKIWNEKLEVFRAVKILIPTQQGDLHNRFETEAKITAKLRHPNIVEIYSVGDWNGLPYLEMELIDGSALDGMIHTTGKLPPSVCSAIGIFVARALTYAHNQEFLLYGKNYNGIIHRDLKPANIMISKHGDLRLMDFGIARPTEASLHTVEGNIVGTMQYLSPEQMDGVDVDARADVYSFGAILYEMLTGTKTFPQETITNLMKRKIMNEYRKFDDFDFSVPSSLAKITQKCLQLDKKDRYASAQTLLADLESAHKTFTSDSPEAVLKGYLADPSSIAMHSGKKLPSWLSLKIILPAVGVAIVGTLVLVFLLTGPKSDSPSQTNAPAPRAVQPAQPQAIAATVQSTPQKLEPLAPEQSVALTEEQKPEPNEQEQQETRKQKKTASVQTAKKPVAQPKLSPLENIKKTYESTDLIAIGQNALAKNAYDDAILALTNVDADSPQHQKATIMLIDAYIQSDKLRLAKEIILNEKINDAQFCLLAGEVYQKMGRNKDAIENFQTALTKPSQFRSIREVRNDALYFIAISYSEQYKDDASPDNKSLTMQAWRVVKNMYGSIPDSPRFKRAVGELATIQ